MISLNPSIFVLGAASLLCANAGAELGTRGAPAPVRYAANVAVAAQASPVQAEQPAIHALTIAKAPDGLFYLSGSINGAPMRFLVDTGANMVVLTADDARRIGLPSGDGLSRDSIETASGRSGMERVSLAHVSVAGRDVANVDAAVMREGLKVSLLGQNLLAKLGPITISGDEITLQPARWREPR